MIRRPGPAVWLTSTLIGGVAIGFMAAVLLRPVLVPIPVPPPPERLVLRAAGFADLPGWRDDSHFEAAVALRRSCAALGKLPDERPIGPGGLAGAAGDWRDICAAAEAVSGDTARDFFETWFRPFAVANNDDQEGLFTGYYEASLDGAREPGNGYATPLLARPDDLVTVALGAFRDDLKGRRVAGRVVDGRLRPYPSRAEIEAGALAGRGLELVWVDDPVDAFVLHIQGSGRVALAGGGELRLGYAGQNGHPYTAIGRDLIAAGALTRESVSMQSIRAWLAANPARAQDMMDRNASYIFFRELSGAGPVGAQGVALTPGRSLAVDRKFMPLSAPVWLDTVVPDAAGGERALRRLLIAQDTGGAIRGPVRGDVFWGHGDAAAEIAGRMKRRGRYFLLLPRAVAEARAPTE